MDWGAFESGMVNAVDRCAVCGEDVDDIFFLCLVGNMGYGIWDP